MLRRIFWRLSAIPVTPISCLSMRPESGVLPRWKTGKLGWIKWTRSGGPSSPVPLKDAAPLAAGANMIAKSERDKQRRKAAIDFINECKKSAQCAHCGLADPRCIEFHHWNPDSKAFGISQAIRLRMNPDRIAQEMEKCVPVCSNCHAVIDIECVI